MSSPRKQSRRSTSRSPSLAAADPPAGNNQAPAPYQPTMLSDGTRGVFVHNIAAMPQYSGMFSNTSPEEIRMLDYNGGNRGNAPAPAHTAAAAHPSFGAPVQASFSSNAAASTTFGAGPGPSSAAFSYGQVPAAGTAAAFGSSPTSNMPSPFGAPSSGATAHGAPTSTSGNTSLILGALPSGDTVFPSAYGIGQSLFASAAQPNNSPPWNTPEPQWPPPRSPPRDPPTFDTAAASTHGFGQYSFEVGTGAAAGLSSTSPPAPATAIRTSFGAPAQPPQQSTTPAAFGGHARSDASSQTNAPAAAIGGRAHLNQGTSAPAAFGGGLFSPSGPLRAPTAANPFGLARPPQQATADGHVSSTTEQQQQPRPSQNSRRLDAHREFLETTRFLHEMLEENTRAIERARANQVSTAALEAQRAQILTDLASLQLSLDH